MVPRNPTGNPIKQSCRGTNGDCTHAGIVVRVEEPTRMIGDGHKARIGAERFSTRRRDTPEKPGEAWGPQVSVKRREGTESPPVVL